MAEYTGEHPLRAIVEAWLARIRLAAKSKHSMFGRDADEVMQFFNGPHNWMFDGNYSQAKRGGYLKRVDGEQTTEEVLPPSFRICVNKAAEARDLFGPSLYHQNPFINVEPHDPPIPPPEALGIVAPPDMPQAQQMAQQAQQMGMMPPPMPPDVMQYQQQMMQYQQTVQQQQTAYKVKNYCAGTLEYTLNYLQRENDKKRNMRLAIDEAILKGRGLLWTEEVTREGFEAKLVGSFYDTVDNLLLDPDAEHPDDITWIARRCVHPLWYIEKEYDLPEGTLQDKGNDQSTEKKVDADADPEFNDKKARGKTNDLLTYWKLYSKMGMGDNLSGMLKNPLHGKFDELGPYLMLVLAEDIPYPLNLPSWELTGQRDPGVTRVGAYDAPRGGGSDFNSDAEDDGSMDGPENFELPRTPVVDPQTGQPPVDPQTGLPQVDPLTGEPETEVDPAIFVKVQWPIPFWADGGWPCLWLDFRDVPNSIWPMSLLKPGIGELRFINWCLSFLAVHIRKACTTTVGVRASAEDDLIKALLSGHDYNVVPIRESLAPGGKIEEVVSFLQHPQFNGDIWKVLEAMYDSFDKRVGLSELLYGETAHSYRSAAEANAKQQATALRPDDMANRVEDFASKVAAREAMALRWLWEANDAAPILGPVGAMVWQQLIKSNSLEQVVREYNYRIEAGSTRKPNKQTKIQQMNLAAQGWGQFLENYYFKTGDPEPIDMIMQEWADANDIANFPSIKPPPPPQGPEGQSQGSPQGPPQRAANNRIKANTNGHARPSMTTPMGG